MNEDDVVREVRAAREEIARAHGFDVRRIVAHLQELDRSGDRTVVRLAPRRPLVVNVKSVATSPQSGAAKPGLATTSRAVDTTS